MGRIIHKANVTVGMQRTLRQVRQSLLISSHLYLFERYFAMMYVVIGS